MCLQTNIGEHKLPAQSITLEFPKAFSEVITLYDLGGGTIYAGSVWVLKVNPKPDWCGYIPKRLIYSLNDVY